jgi:peroxiredoxin
MKIIVLAGFLILSCAGYSQTNKDEFTINGKVKGKTSGKIYLSAFIAKGTRDSVVIQNGSFHFTGKVDEPTPYILSLESNYVNKPLLMFFAETGAMKIAIKADDIRNGKVKGSQSQKEYSVYQTTIKPYNDQISKLADRRKKLSKDDKIIMDSITAAWDAIATKKRDAEKEFIKANPQSAVSAWVITRSFIFQPDLELLESLYNRLSPAVQATSYGNAVNERLEKEKFVAVGKPAPEFSQADTLGKMVALKEFRGKYVLVDFWASWCVPCRAENPNVVKAFNANKDKNFTILGVSLDQPGKKQAWLDAIHKDELTWTHVSDLKFWDNEVARLYGINSVPSNFLIDPSGKIVARNLAGKELSEKLNELLK